MSLRFRVTSPPSSQPAPAGAAAPQDPTVAPETLGAQGAPAVPAAAPIGPATTAVIAAAGDIACSPADPNFNGGRGVSGACQQRATASVATSLKPDAVLGLGDMQYESGALDEFTAVYRPTWGSLDSKMFPVPGNHDYGTAGAAGFFSYFGTRAGPTGRGYYSFDIGAWHIIALNSNCQIVACASGSPQNRWLRADLAGHPNACTLAFFHHPLFSSSQTAADPSVNALWDALYSAGADLVLVGHRHNYERFAPQTPSGGRDTARGIREFVVGTGGAELHAFPSASAANSQTRNDRTFGVLRLVLRPTGYDWRFAPAAGGSFSDAGTGACH